MTVLWAASGSVAARALPLLAALWWTACGLAPESPGACRALGERKLGITAGEYATCAAEIMSTLDTLGVRLDAYTGGDPSRQAGAADAYARLRTLLRESGIAKDARTARFGRVIERWPEGAVRGFNRDVYGAVVQYMAALNGADRGIEGGGRPNFEEGNRLHRQARQLYDEVW